jgi:general secretion pathway protein I
MIEQPCDRSDRSGFTLIEVLVAFTILGVALLALFDVFSTGLKNVKVSEGYATATTLAESKLATLGVTGPLVDQVQKGEFDARYHWEATVRRLAIGEPTTGQPAVVEPYQLTVTVTWGRGNDHREVSLSTIRLATVPQ